MKTISKRIISMMLAAMMILSLCGHMVGKAEAKEEQRPGYYKIEFSENGRNDVTNMPSPKVNWVANAVNYTIPSTEPKRAGYSFAGWYEASNPSTVYKAGQRLTDNLQRNYTLIPKWKQVPGVYNITFNKNGASVTNWPTDFTVSPGVNFQIPNITPKRTGYFFKGWDTSTAAKTIVYTPGQSPVKVSANLALYPVWVKKQYAVCNDAPGPSKQKLNGYTTNDQGALYVGTSGFAIGGWAIHDGGIKSFSFRIVNDETGKNEKVENSSAIGLKRTVETGLINKKNELIKNYNFDANTDCTRYSGTIQISHLSEGKYTLWVTGTTRDGNTFNVAKISFEIIKPKTVCKTHKYGIEISNKHENPADDTVYVYRCTVCKEPYYEFYYRAYAAPEGTYNLPHIRHFMSNSGSNEYAKLKKTGITCTSYELRDSDGKPSVYSWSKDYNDKSEIVGGACGDQTGNEWLVMQFQNPTNGGKYLTKVIRYTNKDKALEKKVRQTIARLCIDAAHNDYIGYDQGSDRSSYYYLLPEAGWEPSKIDSVCAADCASGLTANLIATGQLLNVESLINLPAGDDNYYSTYSRKNTTYYATVLGDEKKNGDAFKVYTFDKDITLEDLIPGDILVYEKKGRHVAVNISFGKNVLDQWNKQ